MRPPEQTPRQRIMELITGTLRSARQLAKLVEMPERQVEDHLAHIVRSVMHDRTRRFILEPSECRDCDYRFRSRTRLTTPSRCPHCRSEAIAPPRYGIALHAQQP